MSFTVNDQYSYNEYLQNLNNITDLTWNYNIREIRYLPDNLRILTISNNRDLERIYSFPESLEELDCFNNPNIRALPRLPNLSKLICYNNDLTSLPSLPDSLVTLDCSNNRLLSLPRLPNRLEELSCQNNRLTTLPEQGDNLRELNCGDNQLISLVPSEDSELSGNLVSLTCGNNRLTSLPPLPESLKVLTCGNNQLTILPPLIHTSLEVLFCFNNQLTFLPTFPSSLTSVNFSNNPLIQVPEIENPPENLELSDSDGEVPMTPRDDDNPVRIPMTPQSQGSSIDLFEPDPFEEPEEEPLGVISPFRVQRTDEEMKNAQRIHDESSRENLEAIQRGLRRIQEESSRESALSANTSEEKKYDHHFNLDRWCNSTEDMEGEYIGRKERIVIFYINGSVFCHTYDDLIRTWGDGFRAYETRTRRITIYKLPVFGYIDAYTFLAIQRGENTFRKIAEFNVLDGKKVFTFEAITRNDLINELEN